jgi:subtilase family serine protease
VTAVAAAAAVAVAAQGASGASASTRHVLAGNTAPYAKSANDAGAVSGGKPVEFTVYLGWRDRASLQALVNAVSDPRSPSYAHYLTPAQFRARFSPTSSQVESVKAFLRGNGLKVGAVPANHHFVRASGTVAAAEKAFGVSIRYYRLKGRKVQAPSSSPSVPHRWLRS